MSSLLVQQIIVAGIVLAALGFVAAKAVRAVRAARSKRDAACGSSCGCGPAVTPAKDTRASSAR